MVVLKAVATEQAAQIYIVRFLIGAKGSDVLKILFELL
jgi:hypothetical protein